MDNNNIHSPKEQSTQQISSGMPKQQNTSSEGERGSVTGDNKKSPTINLHIKGSDNTIMQIRARFNTKIQKILDAYARQSGMTTDTFKLMDPEGRTLSPSDTIEDSQLENDDQLSVVLHQVGG